MKIGMIFECGPDGPDLQVCKKLAAILVPTIEISHATLSNKPNLLSGCGEAAAQLIADGCQRIFIIWDLYPAWRNGIKPCRTEDRRLIFEALRTANVRRSDHVHLVCIKEELEAWLIADGRALSKVLSSPPHRQPRIKDRKNPDRVSNPKAKLNSLFKQHGKGKYIDLIHASKIIDELPDIQRIRRSDSFLRFQTKIL